MNGGTSYNQLTETSFKNPFEQLEEDAQVMIDLSTNKPLYNSISDQKKVEPQSQSTSMLQNSQFMTMDDRLPQSNRRVSASTQQSMFNLSEAQPQLDQFGDPPLCQDIGIDIGKIKSRILAVIKLEEPSEQMITNPDLFGPTCIALLLGCLLLAAGKIHFGDIYAIFIIGNLLLFLLMNLMSNAEVIPLYNIMSTVGYALLPMLIVGFVGVFLSLQSPFGICLALAMAGWSAIAASKIMRALHKDVSNSKQVVVGYPLFLFYVWFSVIVIF